MNRSALGVALLLFLAAGTVQADPAKLAPSATPTVTVNHRTIADVQNAIVAMMLPTGHTPTRQDQNVIIYEFPLSFWQSIGVQMAQGNSGWQEPKGRLTFTMAQTGPDVLLTSKFETIATNVFNASNAVEINGPVVFNENFLGLQLVAAYAEGRMTPGPHNALGIVAYEKPTRKTRKLGMVIREVMPGGPADLAGLRAGDLITHIGGVPLAEQSLAAVQLLGFLQIGEAALQVQGKGAVTVRKTSQRESQQSPKLSPAQLPTPHSPIGASENAVQSGPNPRDPAVGASWWQKAKQGTSAP